MIIFRIASLLVIAKLAFELYTYSFLRPTLDPTHQWTFTDIGVFRHFADLQVATFNGKGCPEPIQSIYAHSCYFHPWGVNIPTTLIRLLRFFGLGEAQHITLGFCLGITALLLIAVTFWLTTGPALCSAGLLLVLSSYPFRLALERGNIDLLILCLIIVSACCFSQGSLSRSNTITIAFYILGLLALLFAASVKVYPLCLVAFPLAAFAHNKYPTKAAIPRKARSALFTTTLISSASIAGFLLPDIPHMLGSSYADISGGLAYGLATFPGEASSTTVLLLARILEISSISLLLLGNKKIRILSAVTQIVTSLRQSMYSSRQNERYSATIYIFGSTLFVATYFTFTNGIYRFSIPLALCLPLLLSNLQKYLICSKSKAFDSEPLRSGMGGILLLITYLAILAFAGFRPHLAGSNLQHLTSMFLCWIVTPYIIAFMVSSLVGLCQVRSPIQDTGS